MAWDVYFEFKTAESTGTMFHSVIDKETIEMIVVNGTHILIKYGSSIEVCTPKILGEISNHFAHI